MKKYIKLYNFTKNEGEYKISLADMMDLFEATTKNQKHNLHTTIKKVCKNISKYSDINLSVVVEYGTRKRWGGSPRITAYNFISIKKSGHEKQDSEKMQKAIFKAEKNAEKTPFTQHPKYIKLYNFTKNQGEYIISRSTAVNFFEATTKNQKHNLHATIKKVCKNISKYSDINLSVVVEYDITKGWAASPSITAYNFISIKKSGHEKQDSEKMRNAVFEAEKKIGIDLTAAKKAFYRTEEGKAIGAQIGATRTKQNPRYIKLYNFTKNEGEHRISLADMMDLFEATTKTQKKNLHATIKKVCKNISKYSDINLSVVVEYGTRKGWGGSPTPITAYRFITKSKTS